MKRRKKTARPLLVAMLMLSIAASTACGGGGVVLKDGAITKNPDGTWNVPDAQLEDLMECCEAALERCK